MNAGGAPVDASVFMGPGVRRDDGGRWEKALARYALAEAGLEAVSQSEDDEVYDRALGRHNAALGKLLRTAAPDLAAVARKLDLIVRHSVFELTFGEACFEALGRDIRAFSRFQQVLATSVTEAR